MRQHLALFANFICKFGEADLADFLKEIVLPAFTDDTLVRSAYGSSFYLLDVELLPSLVPDELEPAVVGQFVRDAYLRRTQIYSPEEGLVEDEAFLQTSPSAFFVLLLKDHRLIYFGETQDAPDLKIFESTIQKFLIKKYDDFIDKLYVAGAESNNKVTKKKLRVEIVSPSLTVVPITNSEELSAFVSRFQKLQRVDIVVHRKNAEISTSALIANVDAYNEKLKGERTKITTSDSGGLDKDGTVEALQEAGDGANETIYFSGQDKNGDKLTGDNEAFSVKAILESVAGGPVRKARILYQKFNELVGGGLIQRPAVDQEKAQVIADKIEE